MKSIKSVLIILLLCIAGYQSVEAQRRNYYFYGDMNYPMWYNPKFYEYKEYKPKDKHIQSSIVIGERYKKSKLVHQVVDQKHKYDINGNETEVLNCNDHGKIRNRTITTYDSSNYRLEQITFKKKRQATDIRAKYNKIGLCSEYSYYNRKGSIKKKMEYFWDSMLLTEARSYKNGFDLKYKWIHEYYPDKTSKKTTKYNSKGKITKVTTYDCSLLGTVIKKHADTIKMCRFDSFDRQGYFYRIEKRSMENGKMYKTIYKYSKDSIFTGFTTFDEKNRKKYFSEVTFSGDTIITVYLHYTKKGRISSKYIYKQDKQRNTLYSENCWNTRKCDKKRYIIQYSYDKSMNLDKETIYRGSHLVYRKNYFYTFYQ